MLDDVNNYVDYKFQDFHEFNSQLKTFLSEYESKFVDNPFLNDLMISRDDFQKLQVIRDEIQEIQSVVSGHTQSLYETKHDITKIMGAFDVYDEQVFPIEDTYLALTGPFKKTQENLESAKFWASSLIDGAGSMHYEGFGETMKNLPDLNPLADRYNELIAEFDKETKKFADKYLPVVPGGRENPVSHIMKKRPERRIISEALHGPHNNLYNRFPTEETSRKIQGHPAIGEEGAEKYDAVQRKYKNMEKTLRAMGYEPKRVLDIYGNSWWEVKGSAGMIHGTAEYDAYWKGGRIGLKKKRSGKMRSVKC